MTDTYESIPDLPAIADPSSITDSSVMEISIGGMSYRGTIAQFKTVFSSFVNPMTTLGDLVVGGASGAPGRLGIGTNGQSLLVSSGAVVWGTPAGGGDMLASTYDPAGIDQQLVGLTATQTLTNKDLSSSTNTLPSNVAKTDADNVFTAQQAVTPYRADISGTVSIDLAATAKSNNLHLTLTGNVTSFALTNPVDGAVYNIRFIQDSTGSRTITLPSAFKFAGGTAPAFSTAANAVDFLSAEYGSTEGTYMAAFQKGMA